MIFSENRFPLFGIMLLEDFPFALTLFVIAGSSRTGADKADFASLRCHRPPPGAACGRPEGKLRRAVH
jgi:hypothetical protein